ncbi:MAG: hypothetical protein HKN74_06690 [Acidimicrobiia bacterium]|nr:hypothetical protein [Acidimicrobiia bacterium]NNF09952.1 hypothetical protein [Acidimicrobiia bacterium]NNL68719.1 hypothetical protein [Acidimicrobiia bacterium]
MKRPYVIGFVLALVVAACTNSDGQTTSTASSPPVTGGEATTTTTAVPPPDLLSLMQQVAEVRQVEAGLPAVERRAAADVIAAYRELRGGPAAGDEPFDAGYLQTLGVLDDGETVADLRTSCPVPGFYDYSTGTLVLSDSLTDALADLTPLGRRHLVQELTMAATDEAFGWGPAISERIAAGDTEQAAGALGLVLGDASFHADQYEAEFLSPTDRFAINLELLSCERTRPDPPGYVIEFERYGPEVGRSFVEELISTGGVDSVDAAYDRLPSSTEQIYHPGRYFGGEAAVAVELEPIESTELTEVAGGVFGERAFRALLSEGVGEALALQAATGWGGDAYRVLWDGSDTVLVLRFIGDETRDARELAETVGGWASASLGVGGGRPDNTGLAFEGEDYAFVAHKGSELLLVVSSNAELGRDVRNIFWPVW